jgi:GMP synthase (glutamine-hydrolysing)
VHVLVIAHPDGGTAGVFADEAEARGVTLTTWMPGAGEDAPPAPIASYDGVVVLGGGQNVTEAERYPYLRVEIAALRDVIARGQPVLGVCLGHQLLGAAADLTVRRSRRIEMGFHDVQRTATGAADPLISVLPPVFTAYGWHSYEVDPDGQTALAGSDVSMQAVRYGPAAWGVQFHPEVTPAILRDWYADWQSDADLLDSGFDPDVELDRLLTGDDLPAWMAAGRRLFGRFVELAGADTTPSDPGDAASLHRQ